jgi:hypothetical protein
VTIADSGEVDGFLRWVYGSTDPAGDLEAGPDCETWERLELVPVPVDDACDGCTHQYQGTATLDADAGTCGDARDPWTFTYAFGPLGAGDEMAVWADRGFTHQVHTRWSPDLGETQGFQALFVAIPDAWDSGPDGSSGDPQGQYALDSLHYWDLR